MKYKFNSRSLNDLENIAKVIAELIENKGINLILFTGEMGAGKTTFIKYLCAKMGVQDDVTSPTFALINQYMDRYDKPIFHFDIYRIDTIEELMDLGYDEYIYSGNLCMIEWWQKMEKLLPESNQDGLVIAELIINVISPSSREITLILK